MRVYFWLLSMTLASVGAAHAAAPTDAMAQARARLAASDVDGALHFAQAAVRAAPESGGARFVLGLALYKAGRFLDALQAFSAAGASATPPKAGALSFNQGAALFALQKHAEAERAFTAAGAADPKLAPLAEVNAAHAARARGDLTAAHQHLSAARSVAHTPESRALVDELGAELAAQTTRHADDEAARLRSEGRAALRAGRTNDAIAAFEALVALPGAAPAEQATRRYELGTAYRRAGRTDDAANQLHAAADLDPTDADIAFVAAVTDLRRGARTQGLEGLRRALDLGGLDEDDTATARDLLDGASMGLRSAGAGITASVALGGGYDTNVSQMAEVRSEALRQDGTEAAPFASVSAQVGYGASISKELFLSLDYAFDQIGFAADGLDPFSAQTQTMTGQGEITVGAVRLGFGVAGELQLTGLENFGPFSAAVTAQPSVAVDEGTTAATTLRFRLQRKESLADEATPYAGTRIETKLSQKLRLSVVRIEAALRHRKDDLGTSSGINERPRVTFAYELPYSHQSFTALFSFDVSVGAWHATVDASAEHLRYARDSVYSRETDLLRRTRTVEFRNRRIDKRYAVGASVGVDVTSAIALTARYDLVRNDSTVNYRFDDRNYVKHAVSVELSAEY